MVVTDELITQCVRDVRRALSDEAQSLLRTIPRRGYLLTAEVSRAGPAAAVPEEAAREAAEPRGAPEGEQGRVESEGPSAAHVAERRQLSVLFSDLVGSTRLSEWLDPEDFSEVIRVYQERCAAAAGDPLDLAGTRSSPGSTAWRRSRRWRRSPPASAASSSASSSPRWRHYPRPSSTVPWLS